VCAAGVGADVADREAAVAAVDALEQQLPQLVALVAFAGVASPVPYLDVDEQEWRRVVAVNLDGTHWVTQRVARSLVAHGVGRIVGISSVSAQRGGGTYSKTPYSAAKAGIQGFIRSVARELGPHGITANVIAPGPIDNRHHGRHPLARAQGGHGRRRRGGAHRHPARTSPPPRRTSSGPTPAS
jgi:2-hydroxycyclohexanecarboxyl-CoA dehydrogenase